MGMRLTPEQIRHFVREMRQLVIAMTGRPVSLVLNRFEATASTDCVRTVNFNPRPLESDPPQVEVALGMASHEAGHICFSPWGAVAMSEAHERGGDGLARIVNLLLDRKDDFLVRAKFPGVVENMNARLPYIMPKVSKEEREENPFVDFFYACKGCSRPKTSVVFDCMKLIRKQLKVYEFVTKSSIIACAEQILALLRSESDEASDEATKQEDEMRAVYAEMVKLEQAFAALTDEEKQEIIEIIQQVEQEEDAELFPQQSDDSSLAQPTSSDQNEVGCLMHDPEEHPVEPDPAAFAEVLETVEHLVTPLRGWLELLSPPEIETLRGLDEGRPDPTQFTRMILAGDDDVFFEENIVRPNTVTLAFCGDNSSSMLSPIASEQPDKIVFVRQLGVLFNAALEGLENTTAYSWLYDWKIKLCGAASQESGIAAPQGTGANCDSFMAARLVRYFEQHTGDRMMAIFVADGGPDSFEKLEEQLIGLRRMGVVSVQFFIESEDERDGESLRRLGQIFDHQFVFRAETIDEMVKEFSNLLLRLYGA